MTAAHSLRGRALLGTALALALIASAAVAGEGGTDWEPVVSERLVRLPVVALEQTIERDFKASSLAAALRSAAEKIGAKRQTLDDLKAAIALAEGPARDGLRHRLLTEKHAFVRVAMDQLELRRSELSTKQQLLEQVVAALGRDAALDTESRRRLIEQQEEARSRLESSMAKVDSLLLEGDLAAESRYAREYDDKVAAIQSLQRAVAEHPLNAEPSVDGITVTKGDYLRHLVATTEGELALLDMEEEILGYMAKLVSLDALALAEEVGDPELIDSDIVEPSDVVAAVDLFLSK